MERDPREPGSEEYLDSEKYQVRHWDLDRPDSLRHFIARVNAIRRAHPALAAQRHAAVPRHRQRPARSAGARRDAATAIDVVLCVVNLDPVARAVGLDVARPRARSASPGRRTSSSHDLLDRTRATTGAGRTTSCALDPGVRARARVRGPRTGSTATTRRCSRRRGREPRKVAGHAPSSSRRPDWYQDAVIYELHVRAFADSDGDGIGDFAGSTRKLDYLQDLGVTAIWLLPFYPSPLRDEGYDISDYRGINPAYGNLRQFRRFLDEAHRRGLQRHHRARAQPHVRPAPVVPAGAAGTAAAAGTATGTCGATTPTRYRDARIIFRDFERSNWAWDAVAGQYYWHRFYSHQPDLNFDNPEVRREMLRTVEYWLEHGRRRAAPRRRALPLRAGGHDAARTCPRRTTS